MHPLARTLRHLVALCSAATLALAAWAQAPGAQDAPRNEAAAVAAPATPAQAQRRLALVIGNAAYATSPLPNPVNDARAMAQVLREAGFTVLLHTDIDQRQFLGALREFGERLTLTGGTGLFYYAGHGVQIRGRNFLIPVRSSIAHEDEVAYAAVDAQAVLDKMESAGNGTNLLILDACRDNPFARSLRSSQRGLAQMDAPVGTLVAYATAPGSVALDGERGASNGLYTTHLLEAIRQRGLKIEEVFKQVRTAVLRASANKQIPWEASALVGDFYFHPPAAGAAPAVAAAAPAPVTQRAAAAAASDPQAAPDPQVVVDDALWEAVKDSRSSAELFAYLNRFPFGRHAREARRRLLDLAQPGGAGGSAAVNVAPDAPPGTAESAAAAEAMARMRPEESARGGLTSADRRPAQPRRNSAGFAEGDRFEYRKTDTWGAGGVNDYVWRVDRIDADGSLWVNGGRQRLDPLGQRKGGNDEHTGVWLDYAPPLPLLEVARRGAGITLPFKTTVRIRDATEVLELATLHGTLRTSADSVRGPRGMADLLPAVKVEVELSGTSRRSDGTTKTLNWKHTYWMALPLLLPAAIEIVEVADGLTRQNTRHELIAIDQMSLAEAAPGAAPAASPGGGTR